MNRSPAVPEPVPSIERELKHNGYLHWRQLDDGTYVAIVRLFTSVAIITEVTEWGYYKRFCFHDADRCVAEYKALKTADDEPTGWIARRPEVRGEGSPLASIEQRQEPTA